MIFSLFLISCTQDLAGQAVNYCNFASADNSLCPQNTPLLQQMNGKIVVPSSNNNIIQSFQPQVKTIPADSEFQKYFLYSKGYVLKNTPEGETFQEFPLTVQSPHVDFFDNPEANNVWFDITDTVEKTAASTSQSLTPEEIPANQVIALWICGCPVGKDCAAQSNWVCNGENRGIHGGRWILEPFSFAGALCGEECTAEIPQTGFDLHMAANIRSLNDLNTQKWNTFTHNYDVINPAQEVRQRIADFNAPTLGDGTSGLRYEHRLAWIYLSPTDRALSATHDFDAAWRAQHTTDVYWVYDQTTPSNFGYPYTWPWLSPEERDQYLAEYWYAMSISGSSWRGINALGHDLLRTSIDGQSVSEYLQLDDPYGFRNEPFDSRLNQLSPGWHKISLYVDQSDGVPPEGFSGQPMAAYSLNVLFNSLKHSPREVSNTKITDDFKNLFGNDVSIFTHYNFDYNNDGVLDNKDLKLFIRGYAHGADTPESKALACVINDPLFQSLSCQNMDTAVCGDSQVQLAEECDDANSVDGDGCTACMLDCGNGVIQNGELCDDGLLNGQPNKCNLQCTGMTTSVCGNSIIETTELCDDGSLNGQPNKCNLQCTGMTTSVCGNTVIEAGEECDDGNILSSDGCSSTCTAEAICDESILNQMHDPLSTSLSTGSYNTCIVKNSGNIDCYGYDRSGNPINPYLGSDAIGVGSTGYYHCALTSTGNVNCWGSGDVGQYRYTNNNAIDIATGNDPCVLSSTGNVDCYVSADYLGGDAIDVVAGEYHTCILKQDNSVSCQGQSGIEYPPSTDTNIMKVSAGGDTTCVLRTNGNVDCYGNINNYYGLTDDYTGGDAISVSVGLKHKCILLSNSNVDCSGNNDNGQAADYLGGDAIEVFVGEGHTCVLKSNGHIDCYGFNYGGQANDYTSLDTMAWQIINRPECVVIE